MGQRKVRCSFCGAKNTDPTVDRCRICGGVLPDAHERRKSVEAGENFKTIVEGEVETWREYKAGRFESTGPIIVLIDELDRVEDLAGTAATAHA